MNKIEAIKWFKEITGGSGVNRYSFPEELKGQIARDNWNDSMFTFGIEYGVLIALMKAFNIKKEDIWEKKI